MIPSKRILIVEDSKLQAKITADIFIKHGYSTDIADNAEEALEKIYDPEGPSLVLMDIDLGEGINGATLAERIQQIKDIPVVFLTALSSQETLEQVRRVARYGYILKGAPEHLLVSAVEIALNLHEALTQAKKSRQEYLELAENAPIGILKCDRLGNIIYLNHKVAEILGSPSIEETKKINLLTFPQLIKSGLSQRLEDCLQNNKSDTYEVHYESKWGKKVWMRVHVKPLIDKNEVTGAQIIIDDITQKKWLEEENRRREEWLRLMLKGIPSPAWLISKERRILAQNKAAADLFGTQKGDYCWQGIHGGEYLPKEYKEALEKTGVPLPGTQCYFCRGDEALAANEPVNSEVEFAGSVWDTWWVPQGEDVYVHYAVDVTRYKRMEDELYRLSITDPLTGVYNRRYFLQTLEQEIERTRRSGQPLSIIMADVDHFKGINDLYGHSVGDEVLKTIAALFKKRLRKTDCLARWGGEEFVILLPDTTTKGAAILAEDLRMKLSQTAIPGVKQVTASFGVTGYLKGDTVDTLIQRVDDMMYEAKKKGRNCVCVKDC